MSGSPILQNGKLIGAITHVLIDDPTKGYGIFTENMLETAKSIFENVGDNAHNIPIKRCVVKENSKSYSTCCFAIIRAFFVYGIFMA